MELNPVVDILDVAQKVIGSAHINGSTGRVQKYLQQQYKGNPIMLDSAIQAVRLAAWSDERERDRNLQLFHYGLSEAQNYNTCALMDQMMIQGGILNKLEKAYSNRAILPELRADPMMLRNGELLIEKPGFGVKIDIRAVASTIELAKGSAKSQWRQMTRDLLDKIIPSSVQCVYSPSANASSYFPLPREFIDGIVQCCAIASNLTDSGFESVGLMISSNVKEALTFKLNDVKKGKPKDIETLVRDAMRSGWTPPGMSREEACSKYGVSLSLESEPNCAITPKRSTDMMASTENSANEVGKTPTSAMRKISVGRRGGNKRRKVGGLWRDEEFDDLPAEAANVFSEAMAKENRPSSSAQSGTLPSMGTGTEYHSLSALVYNPPSASDDSRYGETVIYDSSDPRKFNGVRL